MSHFPFLEDCMKELVEMLESIPFYILYVLFPHRCHHCFFGKKFVQSYVEYLDGRSILLEEEYRCEKCNKTRYEYSYGAEFPTLNYPDSLTSRLLEVMLISMGVIQ